MRPTTNRGLLAGASILALLATTAILPAAITFDEDFSGLSAGPNLALGTAFGGATASFSAANFQIGAGDSKRIYLGTSAALGAGYYSTTNDFTFTASFTMPSSPTAWSSVFIGMGSPNANAGASGEPTTGSSLIMTVRSDGSIFSGDNTAFAVTPQTGAQAPGTTTHNVKMAWVASTQQATFSYDADGDGTYNGTLDRSFALNGANNSFTASNSQLFIGGGNGLTIDNVSVSVVPEPSVALLGGFGMLGLLRRRRS